MRRCLAAAIVLFALLTVSAGAETSITDRLSADKTAVEVTSLPAGTEHVGVAVMTDLQAHGLEYRVLTLAEAGRPYVPPAGKPVVDLQAFTGCCKGTGHALGGWAGRLQTVPGGVKEPPPEEEPPTEEPPPPPPSLLVGLNAGYWGAGEQTDLKGLGAPLVRLDTPGDTTAWETSGLKVIADMAGPYSSSGVSGVNVQAHINRDLALVRKNPRLFAVETLNEPGGNWFWGGSAESAGNREAYGRLVIAVHNALVNNFGANRPLQLCSYDGGHDSSDAWGEGWSKVPGALAACDGLTNHPYGGTGARSSAILGARWLVERTWAQTHKPIYVTEVGFPTIHGTGDSLGYSERESAWAIYNFAAWANTKGYVAGIAFYGYRDSANSAGYGLERNTGTHKPGWVALQQFAEGKPCGVC